MASILSTTKPIAACLGVWLLATSWQTTTAKLHSAAPVPQTTAGQAPESRPTSLQSDNPYRLGSGDVLEIRV
ncbi:MAG TPA: hypothetical protein VJ180_07790, partial [Pyrinomonadaceae bacterium]|nr:hypothetical protein [Pyrinomonadaceae bacterium]